MKPEKTIAYVSPQFLAKLPSDTPVLLALSGGADSSALLSLLVEDSKKNGYSLSVAHFHHGIRGDEADRDAKFCRESAKKYDIPFHLEKADIPSLARENGNSIEAEARERRYAFFEKIMRENNIPLLVTAHHAEDLNESILLHILRGSGIRGLVGMKPCRELSRGLYLARPILKAEKQDILDYCEQNGIEYVTDSTNADLGYTRNAIRAKLVPEMKELQKNLSSVFARLSESAAETDDFVEKCAAEYIEKECESSIPLNSFNSLHSALKSKVIANVFEKKFDKSLEYVHICSVIELCEKSVPHSSLSLPEAVTAKIENGSLVFEEKNEAPSKSNFNIPFFEGKIITEQGIIINIERNPADKRKISPFSVDIAAELVMSGAHFRPRREGDVIFCGKMNKKIKKLMSEKKLPLSLRNSLPLLVSDEEILWVPSVALCDRAKKTPTRNGFYRISIETEN